ncbi:MAG TPA: peptidoglycan-associated lipoprotein Pal [Patescibacteria group bacterium]|nr:peptidoglycan-associated lipoprotein Pal [Patescibacteria group bacterium]
MLAKAIAIVSVVAMITIAGCSKKPKPVGAENPTGSPLGENGTGGTGGQTEQDWINGTIGKGGPLSDIHFGYNDYTVQDQDGPVLKSNASWLQAHPDAKVQVQGFCDERGSEEYNIALGAKRAEAGKDYLQTLGIDASRMSTISYGKELPLCTDHDEGCWSQNRRDHFSVSKNTVTQ